MSTPTDQTAATPTPATPAPGTRPPGAGIPAEVRVLLGPPPLTTQDDPQAYEDLLSGVAQAVCPADLVEWIWVRDVVNLVWEASRLRRAKAALIRLAYPFALMEILSGREHPLNPNHMLGRDTPSFHRRDDQRDKEQDARSWMTGDPNARARAEKALAARGLTPSHVEARAMRDRLDDLERLERLIALADSRRDTVLREIERRRAPVAVRLRLVTNALIEATAT